MESRWMNKNGKASAGTLIWIVLIAAVVYVGVKFAPPYITYYMIKSEVENDAQTAHLYDDQKILNLIMIRVKEFELPIEEKDIIVERKENEIGISLDYKIDVIFFTGYVKTLFFNIRTVKPLKTK